MARLVAAADVYAAMCAPPAAPPGPRPAGGADRRAACWPTAGSSTGTRPRSCWPWASTRPGRWSSWRTGRRPSVLAPHDPRVALHAAARPLVAILADRDGRPLPTPRFFDLAAAGGPPVVRTLEPIDRLKRLGRSYPEWV